MSEPEIGAIEVSLGRTLPADYRDFLMRFGGAFIGGALDGSDNFPILEFFGAKGLRGMLLRYSDFQENLALPIGRCELGNLWVLDQDDTIHYVNYYGGSVRSVKLANSFGEFARRLVVQAD